MIDTTQKLKYLINFYNRISGQQVTQVGEIPEDVLCDLSCLDYLELIKPFVREDIVIRGATRGEIEIKYRLTTGQAITIGRVLGLYQGNNKKRETCSGHPFKRLQNAVEAIRSEL